MAAIWRRSSASVIPSPVAMQAAISKHDSSSLANIEPCVNAVDNFSSNSSAWDHQHLKTTLLPMQLNWFYVLFPNGWPKSVLANQVATSYARGEGPSFRLKTHCGEVLPSLSLAWTQEVATP